MKAYIIMPGARLVKEVEYDGTPAGLIKLYPYNDMELDNIADDVDHLMYNANWQHEPGIMSGWQSYCTMCKAHHVYHGVAVVVGVTADDALRDPAYGVESYRLAVEWLPAGEHSEPTVGIIH